MIVTRGKLRLIGFEFVRKGSVLTMSGCRLGCSQYLYAHGESFTQSIARCQNKYNERTFVAVAEYPRSQIETQIVLRVCGSWLTISHVALAMASDSSD